MSINSDWSNIPGLKRRFLLLSLAAIGIFLLLVLRLWYLQVIHSDRYVALSKKNRTRYIPIAAPRGPIYDRKGKLMVDNRPSFCVSVLRQEVEDPGQLLTRLSALLGVERKVLLKRWKEGKQFPAYRPIPLAEDVSRDIMDRIQENSIDLPGVLIEVRPLRAYPYGDLGAHLLGYLGEISQKELRSSEYEGYHPGDYIGRSGLEKNLESYLRGQEGERAVEVDVTGKELRILKTRDPVPGDKVYLTVRLDLEEAAAKAFGKQAGAAVALDVRTGEVLAMVSEPSFDPAQFARGISGKEWLHLLRNPLHPLQNKAIRGQYPPGSTFKIVTALAALKAGAITPQTTVDDQGTLMVGNHEFHGWKKGGLGIINLKKAIEESDDIYFYQAGLDMGIDRLAAMARQFGLGEPLGFRLEGEKGGLIPSPQWKRARFGAGWYDGETAIAAIGQGYDLVTPLQLATMMAAVANGGTVLQPHVVKKITDSSGNVVLQANPEVLNRVAVSEKDLKAVRRGLVAAVNGPRGTGHACRLPGILVAGKTGTAQVVKSSEDENKTHEVAYRFRDHALFVAYAPADHPRIAVAVVVEHGRHGGSAAAPIARAVLAQYFGLASEPVKPDPDTRD
jgi:penicillin-binding protein 2